MDLRRGRGADAVLTEISPEGAFAGRVLAPTLLVSAVALIGVSWDDIWRVCNAVSGPCVERSAGAIILSMCSLAAIVWGVGILVRIPRRPVDPQGSSRYVLALGALLSLGCIFVAGGSRPSPAIAGVSTTSSSCACTPRRPRSRRAGCS
jgi:hypothetical protein